MMDENQSNRNDLDDSCVEFDDKYVRCSYIFKTFFKAR